MRERFKSLHIRGVGEVVYSIQGKRGGRFLSFCNGLGVSTFFWKYIVERFRDRFKILLWDYPGHGRSPIPSDPEGIDIPCLAGLLHTIHRKERIEEAVLFGHSMGVQVIFECYRRFREEVLALVPCFGAFEHPSRSFFNTPLSEILFDLNYHLVMKGGNVAERVFRTLFNAPFTYPLAKALGMIDPLLCSEEDLSPYLKHLSSLSPQVFFSIGRRMNEHSAREILPLVEVPTLIIAGERDRFTPCRISRIMKELIPGSELLTLKGASHAGLVEQPERINDRLETLLMRFLHR